MSKNIRAVIVEGNDTVLHIQMKKWDKSTSSYTDFDMHTVKCLSVKLYCEKHGTVIPLEYEIDEGFSNILNCPIESNLLHSGTSYGLIVEGVDENDSDFRFEMLPKELFLVVENTSGLKITDSLDIEGRVGWGINTGGDLSNYYTKGETNSLLDEKADKEELSYYVTEEVFSKEISYLQTETENKPSFSYISKAGHTGDYNDLVNKPDLSYYVTQTELNNYYDKGETDGLLNSKVDVQDLNENYYNKNTVNNLLDQKADTSDLQNKQDTLISGTNIKTINNLSLLGSGNINIEGGGIAYQVQSDWTNNNPLSYAYILNKPDLSVYVNEDELNNYYNKNTVDTLLQSKANVSDIPDMSYYYTKTETESYVNNKIGTVLSSYVTYSYLNEKLTSYVNYSYLNEKLTDYVTKDLLNSYATLSYVTEKLNDYVDNTTLGNTLSSYATVTYVTNELGNKQDTLISGTNIKTINNQSILGSGDITISGGEVDSVNGKTGTVVLDNKDVKAVHDYTYDYFTFEAKQAGTFSFTTNDLQYSLDGGSTWTVLTAGSSTPSLNVGDKILWKQTGLTPTSSNGIGTFSATGNFDVYGNVMSLYYGDNFIGQISLSGKNYAFKLLFASCAKIINAKNLILPATTLSNNCYEQMFVNCQSLISAPEILPATTLANYCYWNMFYNCSSLISAPELPATTLRERCYDSMFMNCTSLVTTPELPATTLGEKCYWNMFKNCSKLIYVPKILPATTLASDCYHDMFRNCTSLVTAPELPATTLISHCYQWMFNNCPKLNYIKCLATNISASGCVSSWSWGVASLGTFIKASSMSSWTTGNNGIPTGWNVVNNGEDIEVYQGQLSNYTTVSDISAMSYVTSTDLSSASYVTSGDLTYYASSSTAGIKIEVVSAMPAQPVANTIYLVQAS